LEALLFKIVDGVDPHRRVPIDQPWVHREIRRPGVTLYQLWLEYREAAKAGPTVGAKPYEYSQFCERYANYRDRVDVTMRQLHRGGEKCFVDYSGKRLRIHDASSGEAIAVELFVGVLGASNYTFAECTMSQKLPDFCASTVRMFEYFCGTPQIMVPDQLRSTVSGPDRYDPEINPTYAELAQHYSIAIVPARAGEPRDKAKVEGAVLIAQRWIVACLRNIKFFSLSDLNAAVGVLLEKLNSRPFRKLQGNRRKAFEDLDRPILKSLPLTRWEVSERKRARVNIDYHVELEGRFYSVPYQLVGEVVDVRFTAGIVEILHKGRRIISHQRLVGPKGSAVTLEAHRPASHRTDCVQSPSHFIAWATNYGPSFGALIEIILKDRPHSDHRYRACRALIGDAKRYPPQRFNAACQRAIDIGATTRFSVRSILKKGLETSAEDLTEVTTPSGAHENVRGPDYYDRKEMDEDDRRGNDRQDDTHAPEHNGAILQSPAVASSG
jgi:transposase